MKGLRKTTKTFDKHGKSAVRGLKPGPLEYGTGRLRTRSRCAAHSTHNSQQTDLTAVEVKSYQQTSIKLKNLQAKTDRIVKGIEHTTRSSTAYCFNE